MEVLVLLTCHWVATENPISEDLQGCFPKNLLHARPLSYNHRKAYIILKLIKFNNFFGFDLIVSAWKSSNAKLTTVQTAQCQSVGDTLQKRVRLFRYSDWLPRKSVLKLGN